jgi:hypothetical protein
MVEREMRPARAQRRDRGADIAGEGGASTVTGTSSTSAMISAVSSARV